MWWFIIIFPTILGFISSRICDIRIQQDGSRPSFQPPNWVFPVVWNVIYPLYGLCAYLAIRTPYSGSNQKSMSHAHRTVIFFTLWIVNLALNMAWTPIFACGNSVNRAMTALWVIVALIFTALLLLCVAIVEYRSLSMALCIVPYITWLFVAYSLNLEIIRLRSSMNQ